MQWPRVTPVGMQLCLSHLSIEVCVAECAFVVSLKIKQIVSFGMPIRLIS